MSRRGARRRAVVAVVVWTLAATTPVPGAGAHWSSFGGDPGRSGHELNAGGAPPVELLWSRTGNGWRDVLTTVLTTDGPSGDERVIFGTGDRRTADGDILGGRIHILTRTGGVSVTRPEGIKLSDEPDAFGDGFGSVSFAETSTGDALGQVWVIYNDEGGVSVAQVDEASGELVQKRPVVGEATVNSSTLLGPSDPDGARSLFFVAYADADDVGRLYKVPIARAGTRQAEIGPAIIAPGTANFVDFASPSLAHLIGGAGSIEAHVVMGDCEGRLYSFAIDDFSPGPVAAVGEATDCVLTASAPLTPTGVRTVLYVATTDPEGRATRVHRLAQEESGQFAAQPADPLDLAGGAANALALDVVADANGALVPGGRVYVTTSQNLYTLDASLTQVLARLSPDDDLVAGQTGFSDTTPAVFGPFLVVARDNGEQLVLIKQTLRILSKDQFQPPEAAGPADGSFAFGQPSLSRRMVIFAGGRGVFAYRLRAEVPATGYWLAAADGAVFAFGDAGFFGSTGDIKLNSPIVALAPTATHRGYWLVARDGGVFAFGDAGFAGSAAGVTLDQPVVGIAPTVTGRGYWMATADGAVLVFGDAAFLGSAGGRRLAGPVVAIAVTPTGSGYWMAAADGAVFAFGDAGFFGSAADLKLSSPVVGIFPTPAGNGYWLVAADGGVLSFGAASFLGSTGGMTLAQPVVGIAAGASGRGYVLAARDGGVFAFGDARFYGSTGGMPLNAPVVAVATTD